MDAEPCLGARGGMSEAAPYGTLRRAGLSLEYLHANSTTHDFLFGAIAELIDNSRDADATRLDIFTVNKEKVQGGFLLCFLDNGCGMTPREATDLIYFGRSSKRGNPKKIGHFGNGLKSGAIRVGKDFVLFTKKDDTMTCLLFSQTFCETEGLTEVIVPIPSWSAQTKNPILNDSEKFATQLSIICEYSPFKSEAELMKQFESIYGKTGTLLVIYNVKLLVTGETELDIVTDEVDLLVAGTTENLPEQWSLRAYTAILYLDPGMGIFIQGKKVETKRLPYCFYRPRMYPYISSSFRQVAMYKLQEAQVKLKCAEDSVKEAKSLQVSPLYGGSEFAQLVLHDALNNERKLRGELEDKERNVRKPKKLFLIFGINIQNRSQDGMLVYSNNRLIRMFEKVGPQKTIGSRIGAGAVGIVDVPTEIMEPTHNKQAFANVKEYSCLSKAMGNCLAQYWKDVGISQKGEDMFWSDLGYLSNQCEKPSETLQYRRRRAVEIPDIVQCDICLKWRLVSLDTDTSQRRSRESWTCAESPNPVENKCSAPEHLPSIPMGSFKPSLTLNRRQKTIIDSIHKRMLEDEQSQKVRLIPPHTVVQHTVNTRTCREKTAGQGKALHKDLSPAREYRIKRRRKEHSILQQSCKKLPPPKEKYASVIKARPSPEEDCSFFMPEESKNHSFPKVQHFEVQVHDEQPYCDEPDVIIIESDSEPEIVSLLLSDGETEDLPVSEEHKDSFFMHKDKQEPYDEKGNVLHSLSSWVNVEKSLAKDYESGYPETSQEAHKRSVLALAEESKIADLHRQKLIETLTSHIKEVLLYFLPESSISKERLSSMGPEDILLMFKLKGHVEENKADTLYIGQLFLQYEQHLSQKVQSIEQSGPPAVRATEAEINLRELQVKAMEENLEHLREKAAQLLLKIHPNLCISNLEDIDSLLEENFNICVENTSECAIPAENTPECATP